MIDRLADNVVSKFVAKKGDGYEFYPAIILVIIEVITQIIEAWQNCRKEPEQAAAMVQNPTWLQDRVLRIRLRRELGWREYRENGEELTVALLEVGNETTAEALAEAFEEV